MYNSPASHSLKKSNHKLSHLPEFLSRILHINQRKTKENTKPLSTLKAIPCCIQNGKSSTNGKFCIILRRKLSIINGVWCNQTAFQQFVNSQLSIWETVKNSRKKIIIIIVSSSVTTFIHAWELKADWKAANHGILSLL